jgi:hypothetical protein
MCSEDLTSRDTLSHIYLDRCLLKYNTLARMEDVYLTGVSRNIILCKLVL